MCGGGRRRIWLRGGCAQRAAGQVLIVSTAPVEKTNEPVNETGNRWPRSWRVAWFAETFIAPGEKAGPDTGRRYACTLCGEHGRGARKIEEDKERKGEWDGGEGSIYIPSATFTQKQASVSEGVSQITVRWLLLSSPPLLPQFSFRSLHCVFPLAVLRGWNQSRPPVSEFLFLHCSGGCVRRWGWCGVVVVVVV